MSTPFWVGASLFNGLVLGILLVHGVSIDPNDLQLTVLEKLIEAFNPDLLWTVALAGLIITGLGFLELLIFYYGLARIGLFTTFSGISLFLAGILIVVPGLQGMAVVLILAGILSAVVTRFLEIPLLQ